MEIIGMFILIGLGLIALVFGIVMLGICLVEDAELRRHGD